MRQVVANRLKPGKLILLLFTLVVSVVSCRKGEEGSVVTTGTYSGNFLHYDSGITYNHYQGAASITFNNGNFTATNQATQFLNGIVGTYTLTADSVAFTFQNLLATQAQPVYVKSGYAYHFEGDSLIITNQFLPYNFSQYRLKKN